jgi:hypothetical protein
VIRNFCFIPILLFVIGRVPSEISSSGGIVN